jgi:hypothetical protein
MPRKPRQNPEAPTTQDCGCPGTAARGRHETPPETDLLLLPDWSVCIPVLFQPTPPALEDGHRNLEDRKKSG